MTTTLRSLASAIYGTLLFIPGGFVILGAIISLKAIRSGDFNQFKQELRDMVSFNSTE